MNAEGKILEASRRRKFLKAASDAYDALRRDPTAWNDYQAELALWEVTIGDGLGQNSKFES